MKVSPISFGKVYKVESDHNPKRAAELVADVADLNSFRLDIPTFQILNLTKDGMFKCASKIYSFDGDNFVVTGDDVVEILKIETLNCEETRPELIKLAKDYFLNNLAGVLRIRHDGEKITGVKFIKNLQKDDVDGVN